MYAPVYQLAPWAPRDLAPPLGRLVQTVPERLGPRAARGRPWAPRLPRSLARPEPLAGLGSRGGL